MSTSLIGKTIGNVVIRERIGGGGVGHIWLAEDTALGRTVAVKMLRPELMGRTDVARRFRSEAQTLARLNHANIATIYSLLEDDGSLFMIMEFVEGRNFAALLRKAGRLPVDPCFDLFHQALDGVHHAHEAGVVHRDLKPGNLMVDERGLVKVLDFGIARVAGAERMTQAGNRVGTPEYMSPEQIRGGEATERSDVYSLAIVLYELLAGLVPFRKQAEYDVMRAQVEQAPTPPREICPEIPEGLEAPILRALEKAPEDRYGSVAEFQEALVEGGAPARTGTSLRAWVHFDTVDREAPTRISGAASGLPTQRDNGSAANRPTELMVTSPGIAARGPVLTQLARVGLVVLVVAIGWVGLNWLAVGDDPAAPTEPVVAPAWVAPEPELVGPLPMTTDGTGDAERLPPDAEGSDRAAPEPRTRRGKDERLPRAAPGRDETAAPLEKGWVIRR